MYSFSNYSKKSKSDWFNIANQETALDINAIDEVNLEKNSAFNIIIYKKENENKNVPIAIFVSNGINFKAKGLIKVLDANFGGLFILTDYLGEFWQIKEFFYKKVVIDYFATKLHIDFVDFMYPALAAIEKPGASVISNPTPYSYVNNNTIMFMRLDGDFIQNFKSTPRYEVRKGLKFLDQNTLLKDKNKLMVEHFLYLDKYKADRLSIIQFTDNYFEELLNSKFYNFLVCVDKNSLQPISGVIYSVNGGIGNYIYNSSTDEGKKSFANKALLYLAMNESKLLGAKYFILGNGYVASGNMLSVTKFKRNMSSNEVACSIYRSPISLKGKIYTSLLLFRKR